MEVKRFKRFQRQPRGQSALAFGTSGSRAINASKRD
jgi:hypothetical protein